MDGWSYQVPIPIAFKSNQISGGLRYKNKNNSAVGEDDTIFF